jgi:hypothetical protein
MLSIKFDVDWILLRIIVISMFINCNVSGAKKRQSRLAMRTYLCERRTGFDIK